MTRTNSSSPLEYWMEYIVPALEDAVDVELELQSEYDPSRLQPALSITNDGLLEQDYVTPIADASLTLQYRTSKRIVREPFARVPMLLRKDRLDFDSDIKLIIEQQLLLRAKKLLNMNVRVTYRIAHETHTLTPRFVDDHISQTLARDLEYIKMSYYDFHDLEQ